MKPKYMWTCCGSALSEIGETEMKFYPTKSGALKSHPRDKFDGPPVKLKIELAKRGKK